MIFWAEGIIRDEGGCDHSVGICYCSVKASIINLYDIWHTDDPTKHTWVSDFIWGDDGHLVKIQRCGKCYAEKSAA
jgi:hypothetical protein